MTIGQLAERAGVNPQTVRYYEREGLIPPARRRYDSNYREFEEDDLRRIRFIKSAQELGFTLKEIRELLDLKIEPGSACEEVKELVDEKIAALDQRMAAMKQMRKLLKRLSAKCYKARTSSSCPILEALDENRIGRLVKE